MSKHPNATVLDAKLRFWSNVRTGPVDCCWTWEGPVNENGYGKTVVHGEKEYAHRFSYSLHYGVSLEELEGQCVLHRCDNTYCVNPAHLFLGSRADNVDDKVAKDRQRKGETVPNRLLTADDVRQIRALREQGYKLTELAEQFGVHLATISDACLRKTWKHID